MIVEKAIKDKKLAILDQAQRLFWEKGYMGTSVRDIAHACNFEPPNIYNYFNNKEEILFEVLQRGSEEALKRIECVIEESNLSPPEKLRALIQIHIPPFLNNNPPSGVIFDVELKHLPKNMRNQIISYRDGFQKIVYNLIDEGIKSGDFAKTNVKMATFFILSIMLRTRIWFSLRGELTPDEIADHIADFVLRALRK